MGDLGDIIDLARSMGLILGLAFYAAIVIWTYKDARKRTEDPILVATFTAIAMLPLFGVLIYMLVRPAEYIADVRERELEIRALERQLGRQERCPYCKSHIEGDYLSCPVCSTKLRQSCTGCEKPLDPRWVLCPFCETEVPGKTGRGPTGPGGGGARRPAPKSESRAKSSASAGREPRPTASSRDARSSSSSSRERTPAKSAPAKSTAPKPDAPVKDEKKNIETEPFGPGERSGDKTPI